MHECVMSGWLRECVSAGSVYVCAWRASFCHRKGNWSERGRQFFSTRPLVVSDTSYCGCAWGDLPRSVAVCACVWMCVRVFVPVYDRLCT